MAVQLSSSGERQIKKVPATILAVLTLAALTAVLLTWNWGNYRERLREMRAAAAQPGVSVDIRALDAAEQLAPLAETRTEKGFADDALRVAEYAVDYAFAAALRNAVDTPAPLTAETREISSRIDGYAAAVAADDRQIAELTQHLAGAARSGSNIQAQLDLAKAQHGLDIDALDDAHQDMARAGGDKQASIKRLRDEHEASHHPAAATSGAPAPIAGAATASPSAAAAPASIELTESGNIVAQAEALSSLRSKHALLLQARQAARDREVRFSAAHDSLQKAGAALKAQSGASKDLQLLTAEGANQKKLSGLDHQIDTEQDLEATYGSWISYVHAREQAFIHGELLAVFWIFLIALLVYALSASINHVFSSISSERRELHTFRTIALFAMQAIGVALILIIMFGSPGNFGTVLAVVGAGLTVALQDFIIGFIGWFILMGKDGMRPGDWVEINGVAGEVLQVGVFKTVLLETGSWAESVSPTGRKVTFVNSFAIRGHYFNFSTSGQWLWDELQVQVAEGVDPYAVAEAIQKIAASEIAATAGAAEQEWRHVLPAYAASAFSAQPTASVRPVGAGVRVVLRYLSKASERQATRARLYRALIELSQGKAVTSAVTPT